jgi:hypothetical protein
VHSVFASTVVYSPTGTAQDSGGMYDSHIPGSNPVLYLQSDNIVTNWGSLFGADTNKLDNMTFSVFKYYSGTYTFTVSAENCSGTVLDTSGTLTYTKANTGYVDTSGEAETATFNDTATMSDICEFRFNDVSSGAVTDNLFVLISTNSTSGFGGISAFQPGSPYASHAYDVNMTISDTSGAPPTSPVDTDNLIKWHSPYSASTTPDFNNWTLQVNGPGLVSAGATKVCLWVQYSPVSTPGEIYVDECDPDLAYDTSWLSANTLIFLPKTVPLTAENWTATAWLVEQDNTTVVATTSTITFTVSSGAVATYATAPPTTDSFTAACTSDGSTIGDIKSAICTTAQDLFVPQQDFWNNALTQTQSNFQNTIPFYYFYQLKDSFTNVSTTRVDSYFINTTLTLPNSGISIPFQFFNTADPTIKNVFDDFRPYITAGLWLGFAMYLVTRAYSLLTPE